MRLFALLFVGLVLAGCKENTPHSHGPAAAAQTAKEGEYERGPHRGRLLRDGDLSVEITIFEEGTEPEFHVYGFWQNKPLDPKELQLSMTAARLGGRTDQFQFVAKNDYLVATSIVHEPHSFDVSVNATYQEKTSSWSYASYEGRTTIKAEAAEAAGVKAEPAGAATIEETIDLPGRITLPPQGRVEIRAPYQGRIVEMTKVVGQAVRKGELLVRVEASDSLRTYPIMAPISGTIVERNANAGDVPQQAIYVIVDNSKLHATFFAFPGDAARLQADQSVEIRDMGGQRARASIQAILPSTDPATQTVSLYAELANSEGKWRPGTAIEGTVTVASSSVPLAVRTRALQRFRDFTVVFAKVGDTYEVRMLKLGRRTPEWTEVLEGLEPGENYVADNAFLIRADIEKSGASHDH